MVDHNHIYHFNVCEVEDEMVPVPKYEDVLLRRGCVLTGINGGREAGGGWRLSRDRGKLEAGPGTTGGWSQELSSGSVPQCPHHSRVSILTLSAVTQPHHHQVCLQCP